MFGIRQFTAVFVGVGLLAWFFAHPPPSRQESVCVLARIALVFASVPLWLVFAFTRLPGSLLGIFPLCLLFWSFYKVRWGTQDTIQLLIFLGFGFLVPLLPLAVYHLWYGVFWQWIYDWTVAPSQTPVIGRTVYEGIWEYFVLQTASGTRLFDLFYENFQGGIHTLFMVAFLLCVLPLSGAVALWSTVKKGRAHPHRISYTLLCPYPRISPDFFIQHLCGRHRFVCFFVGRELTEQFLAQKCAGRRSLVCRSHLVPSLTRHDLPLVLRVSQKKSFCFAVSSSCGGAAATGRTVLHRLGEHCTSPDPRYSHAPGHRNPRRNTQFPQPPQKPQTVFLPRV